MKKVITYGTYDFLHYGHINLLKRAKELGDYLIVGVTSDEYDRYRGKLDVRQTLTERIAAIRATGLADEIIAEEYEGQKISDIQKYNIDIFTIGSDWVGKFDYLNEFCEVVYLPRTEGVSSTQIRKEADSYIRIGLIGSKNPARRFIQECIDATNGIVTGIIAEDKEEAESIASDFNIVSYDNKEDFYDNCDAVYIIERIDKHADLIKDALFHDKHVMCEGPIFLKMEDAEYCNSYAKERNLIVFEAIKTRFFPGYRHLLLLVKSGKIGMVKDIEVSFSQKLKEIDYGSLNKYEGSIYDLAGYLFLPIIQLLGRDIEESYFFTNRENDFDVFTKGILKYKNAVASFKGGLGVKTEGQLIITGTKGYIYVPAPWWKTDYFEIRFEDLRDTKKYFWQFEGEGLRYEIIEFLSRIRTDRVTDGQYTIEDSQAITRMLEEFDNGKYVLF